MKEVRRDQSHCSSTQHHCCLVMSSFSVVHLIAFDDDVSVLCHTLHPGSPVFFHTHLHSSQSCATPTALSLVPHPQLSVVCPIHHHGFRSCATLPPLSLVPHYHHSVLCHTTTTQSCTTLPPLSLVPHYHHSVLCHTTTTQSCATLPPLSLVPHYHHSVLCHTTTTQSCATLPPLSLVPHYHHSVLCLHHGYANFPRSFSTLYWTFFWLTSAAAISKLESSAR